MPLTLDLCIEDLAAAELVETVKAEGHPRVDHVALSTGDRILWSVTLFNAKDEPVLPWDLWPEKEGEPSPYRAHAAYGTLKALPPEAVVGLFNGLREDTENAKFQAKLDAELERGGIQDYCLTCEPGYVKDAKRLLANWNHFDQEFQSWLEGQGYELEWSDEWTPCSECGGLIRMSPDSYGWRRYSMINDDGHETCGDCIKRDPKPYLETLEGRSKKALTLDIDPAKHGYVLVNHTDKHGRADRFQNGLHPGQTDDPGAMSLALRKAGITRFLWWIPSVGQFDVDFVLYLHEDEKDKLPVAREAVGIKE